MASENIVAVQLKEDWTTKKATLAFLFHPSTEAFREIPKNTFAWLDMGQELSGHEGNLWVSITPLKMTARGLVNMFQGENSEVEVPCELLRIGLLVTKEFRSSDEERTKFKAGEMALCEDFRMVAPDFIHVKRVRFTITNGFEIASPKVYRVHRDCFKYGYKKIDKQHVSGVGMKRTASEMH